MKRSTLQRLALIPAAVMASGAAMAQTVSGAVDVGSIVTKIGDQATPVAAIGAAVLLLFVGIKAFKWVRKALS
jgi:hypothetical protein